MTHPTPEQKTPSQDMLKKTAARKPRGNHMGRRLRMEGTRMECPHCKAASEIRTSKSVSATMRETIYQCTNAECGHTFVATTEIVRTLSPSATPDPTIHLPLSTHVRRDSMRVLLDNAAEAPHEPQYAKTATADLFVCEKRAGAQS